MKKHFIICLFVFALSVVLPAQIRSNFSTQAHQGLINQIICNPNEEGSFYSIAEDGFVIIWNEDDEGEHYQISDVGLKIIAACPTNNLIAVYETDGGSVNKVSVWDTGTWTKKKQFKYSDSITSLAFSAKGNYLIVGTATVDGALFYRTNNWNPVQKTNTSTSIVNLIQTSASEKTCVFYSPSGSIAYYDMETGDLKQKYSVIQGLSTPVMYNSNKFLAGIKDDEIFIINAYTGKMITSIKCNSPIILSNSDDTDLYFMEYDGRNAYDVKMLQTMANNRISAAKSVKSFRGPRSSQAINTGAKDSSYFYFGNKIGSLYKSESETNSTIENLEEFTERIYQKIYDITAANNVFYFLTESTIYSSSYTSGIVEAIASNKDQQTQIIYYDDDNFVLWSKNSRNPVTLFNKTKKTSKTLYTPESSIQTLHLCDVDGKKYLVDVESSYSVNVYNFAKGKVEEIYAGSGVQDAIFVNSGDVFVAKSASTNPQVPLLKINPDTYETVPIQAPGTMCFALSTNGNRIYGINLIPDAEGSSTTYTFYYEPETDTYKNILRFVDEDSNAFTYLNGDNLFTNIGKNKLYCYNIKSKRNMSYNRSTSIPKACFEENDSVIILNDNGSISWCKTNNAQIIYDQYLQIDGYWAEF